MRGDAVVAVLTGLPVGRRSLLLVLAETNKDGFMADGSLKVDNRLTYLEHCLWSGRRRRRAGRGGRHISTIVGATGSGEREYFLSQSSGNLADCPIRESVHSSVDWPSESIEWQFE